MRQQVQAISLVAVVAAVLAACGPLGSSSQAVSLSDIALHSDEVPSGFKHCTALSGAYPSISHAYDHPEDDNKAWQAALAGGATDAWIEIYRGRNEIMRADVDQCSFWPTANSIEGVLGGPSIQSVVIKYKNVASAHLSLTRGDFVPLQHLGYFGATYTTMGGNPITKGSASGLGPDSFVEQSRWFTDTFYRAYWQTGRYVSTIVAHDLASWDDGQKPRFESIAASPEKPRSPRPVPGCRPAPA